MVDSGFQLGIEFTYKKDFKFKGEFDSTGKITAYTENADLKKLLVAHGVKDLPPELQKLDLNVKFLVLSINPESGEIGFSGDVELKKIASSDSTKVFSEDNKLTIGEKDFKIAELKFNFEESKIEKKFSISLMGNDVPKIDAIDAQIKEYTFEYNYEKKDKKTDWHFGGKLHLEAFGRLLSFKAEAAKLGTSESLSFQAESKPVLEKAYFSDIEGLDFDLLKEELLKKGILEVTGKQDPDQYQLKDDIKIDTLKLSKPLNQYRVKIADALQKIKNAKEPLIKIPDILNEGKTLFEVDPNEFKIVLERRNGEFSKFGFSIGSNLIFYNTWQGHSVLLEIENGTLTSSYDKEQKEFKLIFDAKKCQFKPLNVLSLIAGMPEDGTFVNMLSLSLNEAHFVKKGDNYNVGGSIKLELNDRLKKDNKDLYTTLNKIFPSTEDERYIETGISYDSTEGLVFSLTNNNGLEIPPLFEGVLNEIPTELKEKIKDDIHFDLDEAFDFGKSYILLEQIRLAIKKEVTLTTKIAFGLPSNLNDRLFGASKWNGLINTYNPALLAELKQGNNQKQKEDAPIQDNLLRVSLSVGTDKVTGQLDKFDIINWSKLDEILKGLTDFIVEEEDALIVDFNKLAENNSSDGSKDKYGRISIKKPNFSLDLKNGSFSARGGFDIPSEHLSLPVRPLIEKFVALLPLNKDGSASMKELTDQLTDSISIKSRDFISKNTSNIDEIDINEIENFFKQFLLKKDQEKEFFPAEVKELIKKESSGILKLFPQRFKDYLSIKIPQGFHFKIDIPADKSLSFCFEVPENETTKDSDFSDCIQLLVPDFSTVVPINWYGIRLRKIGFGTALFNQCFRLDLSLEIDRFNLIEMVAGMGISKLRETDPKLNFILPDPDEFRQTFEAKNLMVIIFLLKIPAPVPIIPIPVPMFYDKLYMKYRGLEGAGSESFIRSPLPQLDIMKVIKELSNCINFFKSGNTTLPVPSHSLAGSNGENDKNESLFNPFEAGPIYFELPGILGYEKKAEGKSKIRLGFSDRRKLNGLDLIHLGANALKFSVLSSKEIKPLRIPIDGTSLSERPVNYLVKFLPAKQRIGSKDVVLFDLFEITFAWALSTPDEFRKVVYPLLIAEQEKAYLPYNADRSKGGGELLKILPKALPYSQEASEVTAPRAPGALRQDQEGQGEEGVVLFLKGAFKVGESGVDVTLGTVLAESTGFATGVEFNAYLANIFQMHLWGALKVDPQAEKDKFMLTGTSSLQLWDSYVMQGSFEFAAGSDTHIQFSGLLDLFPDELFPKDSPPPIKLYTGEAKGKKGPIMGRIDKNGILYEGGIHLELGSFYLGGSTKLIANNQQNIWQMTLGCNNTSITLEACEKKDLLSLSGRADSAINMGKDISIAAASSASKGPEATICFKKIHGLPVLDTFYFDGAISIFGNSSKTKIDIKPDGFSLETETRIGIIESTLRVSGKSLLDITSYNFSGILDLDKFNNFIEGFLDPFKTKNDDQLGKLKDIDTKISDLKEMKMKRDFILYMDKKYHTPICIDGFDYVVPPLYHISYWVNLSQQKFVFWNPLHWDKIRQQITYGLSGVKWTKKDVAEVKKYWQYRKDLNLETKDPPRVDVGRWIQGTADALVEIIRLVENKILEDIRKISNDFNKFLNDLKINSKEMDNLNHAVNQVVSELEGLNNEISRCIKERKMIIRIDKIEYRNLSVDVFKARKFSAAVSYRFLRKPSVLEIGVNLDKPENVLKKLCEEELSL